jgi:O-antigen/teichoic acid export membrane protein
VTATPTGRPKSGQGPADEEGDGLPDEAAPAWRQVARILSAPSEGSLLKHLFVGAAGTAGLHLAATALAVLTSVVLARLLGPSGYGAYAFAFAVVNLLGVPAVVGFDQLTIREISAYRTAGETRAAAGLLRRGDQLALLASLALAGLTALYAWLFGAGWDPLLRDVLLIGLPAVPLLALVRVRQGVLQGLQRIVRGQLPETVVLPLLFLLLVGVFLLLPGRSLDATTTVALHVVAAAGTLIFGWLLLRLHLPDEIASAEPRFRTREWLASAIPLLFVAGLYVVNSKADTVMLAGFKGPEPVGIYNVASRGAGFVAFFLVAGQRALAPTISRLHEESERERLQRVVTAVVRVVVALTLPVALTFVLAGEWILTWVYGAEFAAGAPALAILAVAYLLAVATGPVGYLLMMTGHERDAARGVGVGAALNVTLNALLIPHWSVLGAAVATGTSMVIFNLVLLWQVRRRLGLRASVLGRAGTAGDSPPGES